jgi:HK97 family phage major capsid protein
MLTPSTMNEEPMMTTTRDVSIQDLREKRWALASEARKLLDDNPGAAWNSALEARLDRIYAEIDTIDRQIHDMQREMEAAVAGQLRNAGGLADDWRDPSTGRVYPVLRAGVNFKAHFAANGTQRAGEEFGLADFVRGVAGMRSSRAVQNALSEGTDAAGGYTVPTMVLPGILEALVPASSLLTAGAGMVFLDEGAKSYTVAGIASVPTAAWRAENANVAEAEPTFRAVVATPRSLSFYFKVSRELLADSPNLETALRTAIAQSFAKELDRAGLRGSGTAPEPRGILNTSGVQSVTNGANGASLSSYSNFVSAVQAIRAADAPMPTAAIMAPRSFAKLAGLTDTTNQPLRRPPLLDTWTFIDTSAIPINLTVGTSTDCSEIYVGDFRTVQFFFREGPVSIQLLKEAFATSGQLAFVCHARVDVGVLYPSALAVVTGVRP